MTVTDCDRFRTHHAWLEAARAEGKALGEELLALPVGLWRGALDADERLRSYGTLSFLLEAIHDDLQNHPAIAYERALVVLAYVDRVATPAENFRTWLSGVAWREYANALRLTRNPCAAVDAAARSRTIFEAVPGYAYDAAKSSLVEAQSLREIGEFDEALALAQSAASVFKDHGDTRYYMFARMTEAWVLFGHKQFRDALAIFSDIATEAERKGDTKTLASCLCNAAECARALGDAAQGEELNTRAVALLNNVGSAIDAPRVRWAHALDLARRGRANAAVSELFKVRAEFLALGMNTDAAVAALGIARIRYETGQDVSALCSELVRTFSEAGMTQSALEALAYLREESRRGSLSVKKINHVRRHIAEAARLPSLLFVPLVEDGV